MQVSWLGPLEAVADRPCLCPPHQVGKGGNRRRSPQGVLSLPLEVGRSLSPPPEVIFVCLPKAPQLVGGTA